MTVSVLIELLNKYCIMEQIESVTIRDSLMTVLSSRVVDVNKSRVQFITRTLEYNDVYSQWECTYTGYSDMPEN